MTLVSIPLMDKTGRRTLHLYGLGGMFIFSIFITISFLIKASWLFSVFESIRYRILDFLMSENFLINKSGVVQMLFLKLGGISFI